MVLAILAASAQEGSLRVSENCKWRIRKEFQAGRLTGGINMLGYKLIEGKLHIIPEEAEIVRRIFTDYLSGMGLLVIMKKLRAEGVTISRTGLAKMLRNEKYTGNMLLQKTYCVDHLSKQKKINRGELPQFFVEDSHEAIIPQETFEAVQREIERRSHDHKSTPIAPGTSKLACLIRCGICGTAFQRKYGGAPGYKKHMWICSTFNSIGKQYCANQQIPENILLDKIEEAGGFAGLERITATGPGVLSFLYKDGKQVDLGWQNPSRAQSWTPEMKEAARQRSLAAAQKRKKQEANP